MNTNQTRTIVVNANVNGQDVIRTFQLDPKVDVLTGGRQSLVTCNGLLVAEIIERDSRVSIAKVKGTKREFQYTGGTCHGSSVHEVLTNFIRCN